MSEVKAEEIEQKPTEEVEETEESVYSDPNGNFLS